MSNTDGLNKHDREYHGLVDRVFVYGGPKTDRTGTGTISVFGEQMRFNLRDGTVPLLTTKKMHVRSIIRELLWYIAGGTNNNDLLANNVSIWNEWAREDGELGPVYGYQWRKWPGNPVMQQGPNDIKPKLVRPPIDQLAQLIEKLKTSPDDRRLIVSAWNVADLPSMALPPCHYLFQCYTRETGDYYRVMWAKKRGLLDGIDIHSYMTDQIHEILNDLKVPTRELSLMLNQRSADVGLGVPFNIIQYSLLMRMLAEVCGYLPGEFIWRGGDVHIYSNHKDQLKLQLTRRSYEPPTFEFARPVVSIDDFGYDDFVIQGYQSHPAIKMDVAV